MTLKELESWIGRPVLWLPSDGVAVAVRILDAKRSYGKLRAQITPLAGSGKPWVELKNLRFEKITVTPLTTG